MSSPELEVALVSEEEDTGLFLNQPWDLLLVGFDVLEDLPLLTTIPNH